MTGLILLFLASPIVILAVTGGICEYFLWKEGKEIERRRRGGKL